MKIGFDISQTGNSKAGCGYVADSLVRHLAKIDPANEYLLFPTFGDVYWDPDWSNSTAQISQGNFRRVAGAKHFEELMQFWRRPQADLDARLGELTVLHANNFFCPTGLRRTKLVYTLYDLGFMVHPEWTTEANRLGCFDGVFNASLYADHIIAISDYSRQHFLATFPYYPKESISVIYPASRFANAGEVARPAALGQLKPEQFWLSVGTLEPRKNHRCLLHAYAKLKSSGASLLPLALAGGSGWLMDDFDRLLAELGLQHDVIQLGYVDDIALQWLYQNCFALVYPTFFEGFGLPVIECMSLGAATIASNVTSIPEIAGDAALLVDPHDHDAVYSAMLNIARSPSLRYELQQSARKRAEQFSWERAAQALLQLYQSLAASG